MFANRVWTSGSLVILVAILSPLVQPKQAAGSQILRVWRTVYQRLHPGTEPPWRGQNDAVDWGKAERDRLEPIVMSIIRGEEPDIQWSAGVAIARHIPTPAICDLLLEESRRVIDRAPDGRLTPNSVDERGLINMLNILAEQRRAAARPLVLKLAAHPGQSSLVIEHCLGALQKLGLPEDIAIVRQIGARRMNEHIDRLCELTEKVIAARIKGEKVSPNADQELRDLSQRFLRALETQNQEQFVDCFPHAARRGIDADDLREWRENEEGAPALKGFARALEGNARFDIDDENLTAGLDLPEGYRVEFIYEVDGWKISNIRPTREPQREKPDR